MHPFLAHIGLHQPADFSNGFFHPLTGLDHILALVAVGIWAAQTGGRAIWIVPASFVTVMVLGGALAAAGFSLTFVETGIALSILILGLLIAAAIRFPVWTGAALVAVFAVFHGYAHGSEMPAQASAASFALGFALATALLHLAGIALALGLSNNNLRPVAVRFAGLAIAAGSLAFLRG